MTRKELAYKVADRCEVTRKTAEVVIENALGVIQEEVADGHPVTFKGFGTFKPHTRRARMGRNPATGEPVKIPEKTVPKFKPGSEFCARVNK